MTKRELDWAEVENRITAYLASGGLFNPELANHDAVRELLIDCRDALRSAHRRGMEEAAGICEGYPLDPNDGVGYFITDGIHGDWTRDGETARVRRHCAAAIRAAIKNEEQK